MSRLIGHCLDLAARVFERVGLLFYRLGGLLHNGVPALVPPRDSAAILNRYYRDTYYPEATRLDRDRLERDGYELEDWERELCRRYGIAHGRVLVLGCGWGREAIALAERGLSVVGLDMHAGVVRLAHEAAARRALPARFLRGDFLASPCKPGRFDLVLLSGTMYSAIPGKPLRQGWLVDIGRLLAADGLAVLSFQTDHRGRGRLDALGDLLIGLLQALPGANRTYQAGDVCQGGHFFHLFQDETELEAELKESGAVIRELSWLKQFAVLSFPPAT